MTSKIEHCGWFSSGRNHTVGRALMAVFVVLSTATALRSADAPTYTFSVLYAFNGGTDGGLLQGPVVLDREGNLYGTTSLGANLSVNCGYNPGCGVVFKVDSKGKQTVLHEFTGGAGGGTGISNPGLILDSFGNLFGVTSSGGDLSASICNGSGCGVVFKLDPKGNQTVLYAFTGGADGNQGPYAPTLLLGDAGDLYGTTYFGGDLGAIACGGIGGCGVVYKIAPPPNYWEGLSARKETVLYTFQGGAPGVLPDGFGPLVRDREGNLYGSTTSGGEFGSGTIYKLDPAGQLTLLYTFTGGMDGAQPWGGVVRDDEGNLFGATAARGASGVGTVYKLARSGTLTVLHQFTGNFISSPDGALSYSHLVRDEDGNLFGTAFFGGTSGDGSVYEVDKFGNETILHNFTGEDGVGPLAGLAMDKEGNLYGTTENGGNLNACLQYGGGCGVVFKLTRSCPRSQ